jgi:hypothetical protein
LPRILGAFAVSVAFGRPIRRRMSTAFVCDRFVIGAGSGIVRAARIGAGHGARVTVAAVDDLPRVGAALKDAGDCN